MAEHTDRQVTEDLEEAIEHFFECPSCRRPIPSGTAARECPECGTPLEPEPRTEPGGPATGDVPPPG